MKVGIISKYYNSSNYGGNLQAYALCKAFENKGIDSEQICYKAANRQNRSVLDNLLRLPSYYYRRLKTMYSKRKYPKLYQKIDERIESVKPFNQSIKHSDFVYSPDTIQRAEEQYDVFVSGSDQVWYPDVFCPAFSLSFVKNKKKFSYAASIASNVIPAEKKDYYRESLVGYEAISVRETKAKELLEDLGITNIQVVLDPVFLISEKEWSTIAEDRIIEDKYLFCYFLGDDDTSRNLARDIAKRRGLKIATIPYLQNKYRRCDNGFGDYALSKVSPNSFLSLIRNAECILTDSFHACAFSIIFKKQFYVCERIGGESMNSRIHEIVNLINSEERYLNSKELFSYEYIDSLKDINYDEKKIGYEKYKEESRRFFEKIIDACYGTEGVGN